MNPSISRRVLAVCITFFTTAAFASANLITNGGFETGNFNGWSVSGYFSAIPSVDSNNPHSGSCNAVLPGTNTLHAGTNISQSVATIPGQTYTLTFFLFDGGDFNSFRADFGNETVFISDTGSSAYTMYSLNVAATSAFTVVHFASAGFELGWNLDDVSVELNAVPDGGSSALLLGLALVGLVLVQRFACPASGHRP